MWSLSGIIDSLYKSHDLPDDYAVAHGTRSLFPSALKNFSIIPLQRYRYSRSLTLETHDVIGEFSLLADGAGRWRYDVTIKPEISSPADAYAVGFVFRFSSDALGHGHMVVGSGVPDETSDTKAIIVTVIGFDPWIRDNWPDIFANECEFYLGSADSETDLYSAGTKMAADAGFSDLTILAGARVSHSDVTAPKGPPGPPDSGSSDDGDNGDGDINPWVDDGGDDF